MMDNKVIEFGATEKGVVKAYRRSGEQVEFLVITESGKIKSVTSDQVKTAHRTEGQEVAFQIWINKNYSYISKTDEWVCGETGKKYTEHSLQIKFLLQ